MAYRAAGHLGLQCASKFILLAEECGHRNFRKVRGNLKLKSCLLDDPLVRIEIDSSSSFLVYELDEFQEKFVGPILKTSIIEDLVVGCRRAIRHHNGLLNMQSIDISVAWRIVTAYYCSFFAATEICRLYGRFPIQLDVDDFQRIRSKVNASEVDNGFFTQTQQGFFGMVTESGIRFVSSGQRPHAFLWTNFAPVLREIYKDRDWVDALNLLEIVTSSKNPSTIRNEWNYKFADRFGTTGDQIGHAFPKLIGNDSSVAAWLSHEDWQRRGDSAIAESIAALCETTNLGLKEAVSRVDNATAVDFS
ncbi:MAG: hypothetical protein ACK5YI_22265 [Rhodospirillales bacterium]|jgi:hypothetical protein